VLWNFTSGVVYLFFRNTTTFIFIFIFRFLIAEFGPYFGNNWSPRFYIKFPKVANKLKRILKYCYLNISFFFKIPNLAKSCYGWSQLLFPEKNSTKK
jgi:hypothetical protein